VQAKNWRLAFFGALALSGGLAGGLVWQSARGHIVPWVVQVDRLGEAQAVAPAEAGYRPTDPQISFHLARFIEQVSAIPADPVIVRQNWLRAYDFTTDRGAVALNDYARANDPFANVGRVQVAVDVSSVIRASPDSFRVAWTERRYQDGSLAATERWSAILTIVVQPPRTPTPCARIRSASSSTPSTGRRSCRNDRTRPFRRAALGGAARLRHRARRLRHHVGEAARHSL
jgi:type IV secretory pathway TrbF-like protein